MVRVICGSVYDTLKPRRDAVEDTTAAYISSIDGVMPIRSRIISEDLQYTFLAYPDGGTCLIEVFSPPDHLTLKLDFSGSPELYEGEYSLAERILQSWKNNDVTIRSR